MLYLRRESINSINLGPDSRIRDATEQEIVAVQSDYPF